MNQIISLASAIVITVLSYLFLDTGISLFFYRWLSANELWREAASDLPDLLGYFVAVGTLASWVAYSFLIRRDPRNRHAYFFQLCGTVMPVAFAIKAMLQFVFGRSNTEMWVLYDQLPRFYWFNGNEGYGCFPSGHMTVFAALAAAMWTYYPRYQPICLGFLLALGLALIVTNYHFLSDVTSGAYLGIIITLLINRSLVGLRAEK